MNRGINLFVFLMSCVIFGVSILIGIKAFNDIDAANSRISEKTLHNITINQSNELFNSPNTIVHTKDSTINPIWASQNQYSTNENANITDKTQSPNHTPPPINPNTTINKKARIDQQKLYMVIAGGFHDAINAQSHQLQLKQLGYDAEVVRFKNSRLHVVCAGKFQNSSKANKLVHTLQQSHRIEAYVQVPI